MALLTIGVFKKNSSGLVYSLSIVTLFIALAIIINFPQDHETLLFNNSYKIDKLSILAFFAINSSFCLAHLTSLSLKISNCLFNLISFIIAFLA